MKTSSRFIALAAMALATASASAAIVTVTGGDAGQGLSLNPSNVVYALNVGNDGNTQTVQGVTFETSYANVTVSNGSPATLGTATFPDQISADDEALRTIYAGNNYSTNRANPVTIVASNLTAGASYQVEVLVSMDDWGTGWGGQTRSETFAINGVATGDELMYSTGEYYNVVMTGVADGSGVLTIDIQDSGNDVGPNWANDAVVNGLVISAVPEPASLGLLGVGTLLLARRRRA